jgi:hypothetical protein
MDELPPLITPPPAAAPAAASGPRMSLAARLLNVFAIPGDVFEEVKTSPGNMGNWLVSTALLVVAMCLSAWAVYTQPAVKQKMREQMWKSVQVQVDKGVLPKDRAETYVTAVEKVAPYFAVAVAIIFSLVQPFWWGLILWLIGAKVLKGNFPFMKAVEVAGLSNSILVLQFVVWALLAIGLSNPHASTSLALLAKDQDPKDPMYKLLNVVNFMDFWVLGVRSVGLARLAGVQFLRAMGWIFAIWVIISTLGALLTRAMGPAAG